MTAISQKLYQQAVVAVAKSREVGVFTPQGTVDIVLAALGLDVEKTPEERIAAFVAAARTFKTSRADDFIWRVIDSHFPEVTEP